MIRRPPRSTQSRSSAASDVYKRQQQDRAGWLIVHAALAATPYLLRRQHWDTAGTLLEQALHRDESPGTVGAVLPPLRRIAAATVGTDGELGNHARLARAVARVDPDQAEQQPVSYTHLRAHETRHDLVCRLLLETKKTH